MDWLFGLGLGVGVLVYAAFVFDLLGFMARDELWLRLLMLGASALYLVYYYVVAGYPLWDALFTNGALAAVNLVMIGVVVAERSTFTMSRETALLYQMFPLFSPGQFRKLLAAADHLTASEAVELVQEGAAPDRLFFVVDGETLVDKSGQSVRIGDRVFIGEIAYLTGDPATATVRVEPGTRYLAWHHNQLERIMRRSPSLRVALLAHLNSDLARKVAHSQPIAGTGFSHA